MPSRVTAQPVVPPAPVVDWTFMTNHTHVLVCLHRQPMLRVRDVALAVGITERAVLKILADLETAGFITRQRQGRNNTYSIHPQKPLRHPVERHRTVADLLELFNKG